MQETNKHTAIVDERVSLSTATWITLIAMIVGGVAANLALIYGMSQNVQDRMDVLDEKWQTRTIQMSTRLELKIEKVASSIPPAWFRNMVESNRNEIQGLEAEFTRDFVRKNELRGLVKDILDP